MKTLFTAEHKELGLLKYRESDRTVGCFKGDLPAMLFASEAQARDFISVVLVEQSTSLRLEDFEIKSVEAL